MSRPRSWRPRAGLTAFLTGGGRSRALDVEPSFGTFGGLFYTKGFNSWNAGASWRVLGEQRGVCQDREPVRRELRRGARLPGARTPRHRWGSALLQAADVSFGYRDDLVVRNASLEVADDGFVGIIGPNGSGKTTLLRLLAGTRAPRSGRVTLDGVPLSSRSRARGGPPNGRRAAGDASRVRVQRARGRADGPLSASRCVCALKVRPISRLREHALASTGTLDLQDRAVFNAQRW